MFCRCRDEKWRSGREWSSLELNGKKLWKSKAESWCHGARYRDFADLGLFWTQGSPKSKFYLKMIILIIQREEKHEEIKRETLWEASKHQELWDLKEENPRNSVEPYGEQVSNNRVSSGSMRSEHHYCFQTQIRIYLSKFIYVSWIILFG